MPITDCIKKHGLAEVQSRFHDLLGKGASENEAIRSAILDYHNSLNDELNSFKKSLGLKQAEIQKEDISGKIDEINKKHDARLKEIEDRKASETKPRVRVSAQEMRAGQPGLLDKNGKISYENFRNELMDSAENVQDNSNDFRLTIPGLDQKGINQAVKNIREGKETVASKKFEEAVKEMHDNGVVSINRGRGNHTESFDIPIKDWIESTKESRELADKLGEETTKIINDEGITEENIDSFKHLFNGFPYTNDEFQQVKAYLRGEAESREQAARDREESQRKKPKEKVEETVKPSESVTKMADELAQLLGKTSDALKLEGTSFDINQRITLKELGIKDGENADTIIDKLIAKGSPLNAVLEFIKQIPGLKDVKTRFLTKEDIARHGERFEAAYVEKTNKDAPIEDRGIILINPNAPVGNQLYSLTHELMHWVTLDSGVIDQYGNKDQLSELNETYKAINANADVTGVYGLKNFKEFLAELLINPTFRDKVSHVIETEQGVKSARTFEQKIIDFFKGLWNKLFGSIQEKTNEVGKPLVDKAVAMTQNIFFGGKNALAQFGLNESKGGVIRSLPSGKEMSIAAHIGGETLFHTNDEINNTIIKQFVKDKLAAGESEADIKAALQANGLTVKEAENFFQKPIRVQAGNPNVKPTDILDKYELTHSDLIGKFASGDTIEDVYGEAPEGDQSFPKQILSDMLQDGRNMIGHAQAIWGGDIAQYGKHLFEYIQNMSNDIALGNKKILLLGTLLGEIKEEIIRNPAIRPWLSQFENSVESYYQHFMNYLGKGLGTGRILRLFRDKYLGDIFADRILDQQQRKEKNAIQNSLTRKVDDDVATKPTKQKTASDTNQQKADKAKQEKKPSLKQQEAQQKADDKLKDLEQRLGPRPKESLVEKITEAIKKINCK